MPNKRVWHLCSNRWNSAITEYALSSAQALSRRGWQTYYSPRRGSPGASRAQALGLEGPSFPHFGPQDLPAFVRAARAIQPDVILLYGGAETFLARFWPSCARLRFRGQDSDGTDALRPWHTRLSMNHCAGLLTPSQRLQERFAAVMGSKPVHLVPLGLDTERFSFQTEAQRDLTPRPLLRILGRLDPVKGHSAFFQLFAAVLKEWPHDQPRPLLEVVGEAANLSETMLRSAAASFGLEEGRDWQLRAERVQNIAQLLSSSHLGVIPSLSSEIICRVAQEFLMAGCPLYTSGVGSLEECLFSPEAGISYRLLSREERVHQLRSWILRSYHEDVEQKKLRAKHAAALFSLEHMGHLLEKSLSTHLPT